MSFRKIMALLFVAGVILTGIGTGVAFGEYSDFTYGGKAALYPELETTKVISETLPDQKEQEEILYSEYHYPSCKTQVEADETMAADAIDFVFSYNSAFVEPYVDTETILNHKDEEKQVFFLEHDYDGAKSDFEMAMDAKDVILDGLKAHTVVEVKPDYEFTLTIRVAPENVERVRCLEHDY